MTRLLRTVLYAVAFALAHQQLRRGEASGAELARLCHEEAEACVAVWGWL